jgi:hypothetical protein
MNIISKEYYWDIKNNYILIYNYKKNKNLKIIFINIEEEQNDDEEDNEDNDDDEEDNDDDEYYEENEDIVIDINLSYSEDNIDYLNAKNLLNSIILPRTYSNKHLIVPIQYYRNNNKILILGSYAITNYELLKTLYEFYNIKILTNDELDEINNDDYWNYVDNAKLLEKPRYIDTIGLLTNFVYIDRIENDIFKLELNKLNL